MDPKELEKLAQLSLDGELDLSEASELEAELAASPVNRSLYDSERCRLTRLKAKVKATAETAPEGLKSQLQIALKQEQQRSRGLPWNRGVAVTVFVASALVLSWSYSAPCPYTEDVVRQHGQNPPPEIGPISDPSHAVSVSGVQRFLTTHLDYPVKLPPFDSPDLGLRLMGARLTTINASQAAYVMYDDAGARISCFAFPRADIGGNMLAPEEDSGETLRVGQHRRYNVVSWDAGPLTYALVSDVDQAELRRLARKARSKAPSKAAGAR